MVFVGGGRGEWYIMLCYVIYCSTLQSGEILSVIRHELQKILQLSNQFQSVSLKEQHLIQNVIQLWKLGFNHHIIGFKQM